MKQYIGKLVKENNYYGALLLLILFELLVLFILGYVLLNILKLFYFDLLRGLTKSWRRGIVCSWLVCANLTGSDPHSM